MFRLFLIEVKSKQFRGSVDVCDWRRLMPIPNTEGSAWELCSLAKTSEQIWATKVHQMLMYPPLQREAPETAKHQQRPVLLHRQAVQELTSPRPAALRRHDLSRNTVPCCFGVAKRTFLSPLAGKSISSLNSQVDQKQLNMHLFQAKRVLDHQKTLQANFTKRWQTLKEMCHLGLSLQ